MKKFTAIVALTLAFMTQSVYAAQIEAPTTPDEYATPKAARKLDTQKTSRQVSDRLQEKIQSDFENTYEKTIELKS